MLRELEGKFDKINEKTVTYSQTIPRFRSYPRFFSGGKDPDEFFSGVPEFLESIGFDRSKIEKPFNRIAQSIIKLGSIPKMWEQWEPLVQAATADNDAIRRLSGALSGYVFNLLDGQVPVSILKAFTYGPGLAYLILQLLDSVDKVNDVYTATAEGFENLNIENPVSVMLDYQDAFVCSLLIVQLSTSEAKREFAEEIYQKTKKAIHFLKKSSPASPYPDSALTQSNIVYKYAMETNFQKRNKEAEKSPKQLKADIREIEANQRKQLSILDSSLQLLVQSIIGVGMNVADPLSNFEYMPLLNKQIREFANWCDDIISDPPSLSKVLDILQPAVEKLGRHGYVARKKSPNDCKHLPCTENLCNSHKGLAQKFYGTIDKEEL